MTLPLTGDELAAVVGYLLVGWAVATVLFGLVAYAVATHPDAPDPPHTGIGDFALFALGWPIVLVLFAVALGVARHYRGRP